MNTGTIISVLVGGLISTASSVLLVWLNKYFDERRHRRELILKTAVESYKQYCQNAKDSGESGKLLLPFDDFIVFMVHLSENVLDKSIDSSNIEQRLAELDALKEKLHDYREKTYREKMEKRRI